MLNRSNLSLAGLLALQIILLAVSALIAGGTEGRGVQPLLADVMAAEVERITIADDLANEMTFARREAGWVLPDADDFPLHSEKVEEVLSKLAGLDTRRLVASNPANFARLEVKDDDFRRRIELETAAASALLYLGGSGGVDTVYARRAEQNDVYLGGGLNSWELSTQVSTWLDANYVNVPLDDVLEIHVQNAAGSFTFLRDGEDWTYDGLNDSEEFEDTKMPIILRNAASIRMLEPLGLAALEEYGLDAAEVLVEVKYRQLVEDETTEADESGEAEATADTSVEAELEFTEATYNLTFGAATDDGDIVLKSSDAEYIVLVRDTIFNTFKNLKHDELAKQPELETEPEGE
ncbi:MAG: DUF4340 domain-containing protein [Chloroflexi bacterium]|nr:DUF4340 domain-containing protein [Chloroflexota bacterium]